MSCGVICIPQLLQTSLGMLFEGFYRSLGEVIGELAGGKLAAPSATRIQCDGIGIPGFPHQRCPVSEQDGHFFHELTFMAVPGCITSWGIVWTGGERELQFSQCVAKTHAGEIVCQAAPSSCIR